MRRIRRGPITNICTTRAIREISEKFSTAIESKFYENNEKWLDVDESVTGGIPRPSERDR
jgi:hypothetical protein